MFLIAREGGKEAFSLSTGECIVLLTLWFIILSCLGCCNKRPSHNIFLNRSIVHAIRMHVSEVLCSGVVRAHTTCVPCPSPTEPHPGPPLTTKPGPAKRTRHGSKHPVWVHLQKIMAQANQYSIIKSTNRIFENRDPSLYIEKACLKTDGNLHCSW